MLPVQSLGHVTHPALKGIYYLTHIAAESTTVGVMARTVRGLEHTIRRMVEAESLEEYGFDHESGPTREIRIVSLCPEHLQQLRESHEQAIRRWIHQEVGSKLSEYRSNFNTLPPGWKERKARKSDAESTHSIYLWGNRAFAWSGTLSIVDTYRSKVLITYEPADNGRPSQAEPSTAGSPVFAYYGGHRNSRGDSYRDVSPWEFKLGGDEEIGPLDSFPTFYFQEVRVMPDTLSGMIEEIRGSEADRARRILEEEAEMEARREADRVKRSNEVKEFFVV